MSLVGIIANQKNEEYMMNVLKKQLGEENIINITNKNIMNIKNVHFETILLDKKIEMKQEIKRIISNAKYIVVNTDMKENRDILQDLDLTIITYGFNSKCTLTPSSVTDNTVIICLQRIIKNKKQEQCEPQEWEYKIDENIDISSIMGMLGVLLIEGKKLKLDS